MDTAFEHDDKVVTKSADKTDSLAPLLEKNRLALARSQETVNKIITDPDTGFNTHVSMLTFRALLNGCFLGELSEDRSLGILAECRNLEEKKFKRRLLSFEQVDQIPVENRPVAGRLSVLLGLSYYRGEGMPQDYSLARRYFKLGMDLNQPEAYLIAAFMAERGHGEEKGEKNVKLRDQYIRFIKEDVNALKKAVIDVPNGVPVVTQQNINQNFPADPDNFLVPQWYPGHRVCVAVKKLDLVGAFKVSTAVQLLQDLKPLVITVAEDLYKAHQTFLRSGGFLEQRTLVAKALAKLYKERLEAFDHYQPTAVLAEEGVTRTEEDEVAERAELAIKEALQEIALYTQYYYGLIDPSIYEQLRDSTAEDLDILITLILQDRVCSARSKMKRILALTEWTLPENLFDTDLQLLENLGHVAYQAVNDCLALISHGEPEHEADFVEEMIDCQDFADAVLSRLQQSETQFSILDNTRAKKKHYDNLSERAHELCRFSYQKMASQGFEGFARAIRFLMGKTTGSQELVRTDRVANIRLFSSLLDQHALLMLEPSESTLLKQEVMQLIPLGKRTGGETRRVLELEDELDFQRMDAIRPEREQVPMKKTAQRSEKPLRQTLEPTPLLVKLQQLADFCRILGQAQITVPPALQSLSRNELFELFENGMGEGSEAARQLLKELFIVFNQHRVLIRPIEKAIQRYESYEYQPSQFNFFSSTFGKSKEYAKQLASAKKLLRDCERSIFDRLSILRTIKAFFEHSIDEQHALSFALVLMKEMPSYDGEMNFKDFYLQFASYCDREIKKDLNRMGERVREIEMLNTLCKQFFDVRTGLSLELIKDFFSFLSTSTLIGTLFPDDTFTAAERKDQRIQSRRHVLFSLYFYYKRSDEECLALYEYLRELEPRYFLNVPVQGIEVWKAWIFSFIAHTRGQIIDKLQHFNHYCFKQLENNAPAAEALISFENYYAKAGLNRAISQAWDQRKKVPKGLLPTLIATRSKDPEEVFYLKQINRCLSIHKDDNFHSCLQMIYHFLKDQNTPITKDSYAYFLMDSLAIELDRVDKRNNFKAKMAEWKSRFPTDFKRIRLEFTDQLKACYFNYDVVRVVASSPRVL